MAVDWKLLGADMRSSRDAFDEGVRAFGKRVGMSPATISRLERGNDATVDVFLKACAWLAHPIHNKYVKP